jgi:hypothetical protein
MAKMIRTKSKQHPFRLDLTRREAETLHVMMGAVTGFGPRSSDARAMFMACEGAGVKWRYTESAFRCTDLSFPDGEA